MGIGGSLRELARFLDECEETGRVGSVDLAGGRDADGGGTLTADVEVALSTCPSDGEGSEVAPTDASLGTDGRLRLALESTDVVVPTAGHDVEVDVTDATVAADGTVSVTVAASVPTGGGTVHGSGAVDEAVRTEREEGRKQGKGRRRSPSPAAGAGESASTGRCQDQGVPPFRDPDLLAEVYESCETFAEMTDALGMDVTAETVRRYMIDYDIHEPRSYDTARTGDAEEASNGREDLQRSEGGGGGPKAAEDEREDLQRAEGEEHPANASSEEDASRTADGTRDDDPSDATEDRQTTDGDEDVQSPVVLADGIGLPDEVTVDAIVESVRRSDTVHEVKRDIGLDRDDTLDLLRDLDLLDLVVGRLTTEAEREISRETVVDHLRQRAGTQ